MAAASATGEKLPIFVIGKSKKPRCFNGVRNLPCRYRAQAKSWMDSFLFEEWVKELDKRFVREDRKVALIIDHCPAHTRIEGLNAVELIFLPPNIQLPKIPKPNPWIKESSGPLKPFIEKR